MKNQGTNDTLKNVLNDMGKNWKLKNETPEYFILVRFGDSIRGHLIIAILFGWWLFFIPNLIYYLFMKQRVLILKQKEI